MKSIDQKEDLIEKTLSQHIVKLENEIKVSNNNYFYYRDPRYPKYPVFYRYTIPGNGERTFEIYRVHPHFDGELDLSKPYLIDNEWILLQVASESSFMYCYQIQKLILGYNQNFAFHGECSILDVSHLSQENLDNLMNERWEAFLVSDLTKVSKILIRKEQAINTEQDSFPILFLDSTIENPKFGWVYKQQTYEVLLDSQEEVKVLNFAKEGVILDTFEENLGDFPKDESRTKYIISSRRIYFRVSEDLKINIIQVDNQDPSIGGEINQLQSINSYCPYIPSKTTLIQYSNCSLIGIVDCSQCQTLKINIVDPIETYLWGKFIVSPAVYENWIATGEAFEIGEVCVRKESKTKYEEGEREYILYVEKKVEI